MWSAEYNRPCPGPAEQHPVPPLSLTHTSAPPNGQRENLANPSADNTDMIHREVLSGEEAAGSENGLMFASFHNECQVKL